jgi:hypothetical protein
LLDRADRARTFPRDPAPSPQAQEAVMGIVEAVLVVFGFTLAMSSLFLAYFRP